jgi:hypothetical protein
MMESGWSHDGNLNFVQVILVLLFDHIHASPLEWTELASLWYEELVLLIEILGQRRLSKDIERYHICELGLFSVDWTLSSHEETSEPRILVKGIQEHAELSLL